MSEVTPASTSDQAGNTRRAAASPALTAQLALNAKGHIVQAGAGAGRLWQTDPAKLAGMPLPTLFSFEIVSADPEWAEAQWDVLLASALDRSISLEAQPFESGPTKVLLRIETAAGGDAAYFATVTPAAAVVTDSGHDASPSNLLPAHGPVGFFDLNFKSGRIHYSAAWKRQLGYAEHELDDSYDSWLKLIHPDDSGAAPDQVRKKPAGATSRSFSVEIRMQHRRSHWVWLQSSGVQFFSADGRLERVTGVHLDISERKELEEQSLLSDERLERLAGDDALAVFDLDFAHQSYWFSPGWSRLTGHEPDNEANEQLAAFSAALPAEAAETGVAAFLEAPASGQPSFLAPVTLRHADGGTCPVLLGAHRQYSRKRELLRVVGYAVPLPVATVPTASPATTEARATVLTAVDPLLASALGALGEGVILADAQGHVVYLNARAERLTGTSLATARDQPLTEVFRLVNRSDSQPDESAIDLVLAAEGTPRLHTDHALATVGDGAPVPIAWTVSQARDVHDKVAGTVIVFRDPNEMTLTPEELIRANRFDSLGQLAGGIAHDFNNLLTTILGGVSLARENRDYSGLEDAEKACAAAKGLTKQLLAFAKGSGGAHQQVVAPAELLRDAIRIAAAGSTAKIQVEADDSTGPVQVDRGQMLQVFQNLIINALQAMADPSKGVIWLRAINIELAADQLPPLAAGRYVQFEVQDNGSGIPPAILEKIFDPFFTTKKSGTGLGLATVLSIVRRHGGQIGVDSTPGTGTTFTVFLPIADRPVEVEARRAPSLRFGTGRILFMDDDPKICDLTASMLTSLDYTFDIAKHGEEAITLYRRYLKIGRPYDAVIMDLTIVGGMGGEEAFRALRELDPDVRAIVSSGYDNDEMAQRFLDLGFCGYLTKPYRIGELGKIIKTVLGK